MTREEALKYAQYRLKCHSKGDGSYTEHGEFLVAAIKALKEPERKRGRWEPDCDLYNCSICGTEINWNNRRDYLYRPVCGADMRGEEE